MPDLPQQTVDILKLGLIGLGFLLAVIAAWLISAEQKRDQVRPELIKAIYVFMAFSIVLAGGALASEVYRIQNQVDLSKIPAFGVNTSQKVAELTEKVKGLEQLLSEKDKQISDLKGAETDTTSASKENAALSAQVKQIEAEKIELATQLSMAQEKLQEATAEIQALKAGPTEKTALESQLSVSEKALHDAQTEIQTLKRQVESMSAPNEEAAKLANDNKKLASENKKLRDDNKTLNGQVASLTAKLQNKSGGAQCGAPDPANEGTFTVTGDSVWRGLGGQLRLRVVALSTNAGTVRFDSNVEVFRSAELKKGSQVNFSFSGCDYAVVVSQISYTWVQVSVFRM